jgi:hypothetical protein
VVIYDDGTAYVTTHLQHQDGTFATRVTPIPGAVTSTPGFRMMTLGDEAPTPPSALNVTYPEQDMTNPLVPEPFSSTNAGPNEFDMNSLLPV